MALIQLDFWEETETTIMKKEIADTKESVGKIRRALFSRNGELAKQVLDLTQRLEIIEINICRGKP